MGEGRVGRTPVFSAELGDTPAAGIANPQVVPWSPERGGLEVAELLTHLPGGAVLYAGDGALLWCNAQAAAMVGCDSVPACMAADLGELRRRFRVCDERGGLVEAGALVGFPTVKPGGELLINVRDTRTNAQRWRVVRASRFLDNRGGARLWLVVAHDITDRKRADDGYRLTSAAGDLLDTLDLRRALAGVARLMVPLLGDWCAIETYDDASSTFRLATVAHEDAAELDDYLERRRRGSPALDPDHPAGHAWRSGQSVTRVGDVSTGALHQLAVPLNTRDRALGVLWLAARPERGSYLAHEVALANEVALRVAHALGAERLRQELEQARERAQAAVSEREDLLAFVSHDLKNPLAAVLMNAGKIERAGLALGDAQITRAAHLVARAARRMEELIGSLLDAASLQAGRFSVTLTPQPIEAVLLDAVEGLGSVASEAGVTLTADIAALKGVVVACDRVRIHQVLANLIGNAIKFTDSGGRVQVRASRSDGVLAVAVADTGPGIAPEALPLVFERYFSVGREQKPGTGLGLYIAAGIVTAHQGRMRVDSELGVGTTFTFELPTLTGP